MLQRTTFPDTLNFLKNQVCSQVACKLAFLSNPGNWVDPAGPQAQQPGLDGFFQHRVGADRRREAPWPTG